MKPQGFDLNSFAEPSRRQEQWRFSPLETLRPLLTGQAAGGSWQAVATALPEVVQLERVDRSDARLGRVGQPEDRAAAAAWQGFTQADLLTFKDDRQPVVELDLVPSSHTEPSAHHLTICGQAGSTGTVILNDAASGILGQTVEIDLAERAELTVISLNFAERDALRTTAHRINLGRDAKLKHVLVNLGAAVARSTVRVNLNEPGGQVDLLGLYLTGSAQHHEHRIMIDHQAPHCYSRVTYKGALQATDARAVWVGDVLIGEQAEGTDSYELNRNLLLTAGARVDSVPNLEIKTGQIERAGHASATGRFDDEQLFYLQSRGIDRVSAGRLVVQGFFASLIDQIGVPEIAKTLVAAVDHRLDYQDQTAKQGAA
ncbi:MAG: SufD family Fe-S cluster assembly protein [Bifidobacteriaceae bacterium]|jgi:Fe-S cluster assembly protein SufD|nr:SufD family Fe-S cluster assembly protein [Bifidobacteriaceae bacterium]